MADFKSVSAELVRSLAGNDGSRHQAPPPSRQDVDQFPDLFPALPHSTTGPPIKSAWKATPAIKPSKITDVCWQWQWLWTVNITHNNESEREQLRTRTVTKGSCTIGFMSEERDCVWVSLHIHIYDVFDNGLRWEVECRWKIKGNDDKYENRIERVRCAVPVRLQCV